MKPDVVVIGAGPAGCAAAQTASGAGATVLLIERTGFPREKACGDGLTPRALQLLEQLGVKVPAAPSISGVRIRDWSDADSFWDLDFASPGTVASRSCLDSRLADAAVHAGAVLRDGTMVDSIIVDEGRVVGVRTRAPNPERIYAPVTILAEGSAGALIRHTPIQKVAGRQTAFAVRRYFDNVDWGRELHFEITIPIKSQNMPLAGYAWAFPMQNGMANVGIGYFMHDKVQGQLTDLLHAFEQSLRRDPRFANARATSPPIGAPIQIGSRSESSTSDGLLVVGDSAALPNPFWAEGISRALESGILAGGAAAAYCDSGEPLANYANTLHSSAPFFDRIAPSMPSIYRNVCHLAHDLIPFFQTGSKLSTAFLTMAHAEKVQTSVCRAATVAASRHSRISAQAFDRAHHLVSRDRPLFGEVIDQLELQDDVPDRAAPFFYSTWFAVEIAADTLQLPAAIAACLEMLRLSCWLLSDVSGPGEVDQDDRGGYWLSSTLSISLADRILARLFATIARVEAHEARIIAEITTSTFELLTEDALNGDSSVANLSRRIRAAAITTAVRIAGAPSALVESTTQLADAMPPLSSPDEVETALSKHFEQFAPRSERRGGRL